MRVTVVLLTYKRFDYAAKALQTTLDNLLFSGEIAVHIADDGSGADHIDKLREIAGGYSHIVAVGSSDSQRGGYGRNFNLATQAIHCCTDFVLPLEDDWILTDPLDLDALVRALTSSIGIECIRLGYLSFTQALYGRVMSAPPHWEKYLLLDSASDEPHVFAGHPRLETVEYERRVGPWPEGLAPGSTEFTVAHYPESRVGVAWPMFYNPDKGPFAHIGAVRSTEVDAELVAANA